MQKGITTIILFVIVVIFFVFDSQSLDKNKKVAVKPSQSPSQQPKNVAGVSTVPTVQILQEGIFVVTNVIDGDSIEVNGKEKVRYIGVNTPEKNQPYYTEAVEKNKSLVLNKQVKLQYDVQRQDTYGRTLAYVYVDNIFINNELIKSGVAISETIQPNSSQQDLFVQAQKQARESCSGMWSSLCSPTAKCITITGVNNPKGNDTKDINNEWIQMKNVCQSQVSLSNWLLKDNSASNSYTFKSLTIRPNQTFTLHSGCGTDTAIDIYWACPAQKNSVWNNDGDHAFLYNEKKELVADYSY